MKLDLRKIMDNPGGSIPFECELETERLDFPAVSEYVKKPYAKGRVYNEAGVLQIEGEIDAEMICQCDRCGCDFHNVKTTQLNATLVEEDEGDNPENFVLEGDEIDLDDVLSTCFILDMDSKFLCSEDCKGLCPECGKNLNLGPCGCRKEIDPRFAVLEQLLDK